PGRSACGAWRYLVGRAWGECLRDLSPFPSRSPHPTSNSCRRTPGVDVPSSAVAGGLGGSARGGVEVREVGADGRVDGAARLALEHVRALPQERLGLGVAALDREARPQPALGLRCGRVCLTEVQTAEVERLPEERLGLGSATLRQERAPEADERIRSVGVAGGERGLFDGPRLPQERLGAG